MNLALEAPSPKQVQFYKASTKHVGFGGARGGGKSHAVRTKAVLLAFEYPGIRMLIARRTYPELVNNHIKTNELEVKFPREFAAPPDVVCTFDSSNIGEFQGRWDYLTLTVSTVTAAGFKIRVHNGTNTLSPSPGIRWIAVGTPTN